LASFNGHYDIQVTDVNGDNATIKVERFFSDSVNVSVYEAELATLVANIAACTNGKVTSTALYIGFNKAQISAATAPPPASSVYPSVTDGARLSFANSGGGRRSITIPAPLLTDFKTGSNTVNPSDTNISALIADIEGLAGIDGTTNLYEGGVKTGRHARKRVTRKSL